MGGHEKWPLEHREWLPAFLSSQRGRESRRCARFGRGCRRRNLDWCRRRRHLPAAGYECGKIPAEGLAGVPADLVIAGGCQWRDLGRCFAGRIAASA